MRRLYNHFLLLVLFSTLSATAWSQTNIAGQIKDEKGEALPGVNIIVKGKVIGTVTDFDGNFKLTVTDSPPLTLVLSFVGFTSQEVQVTQANTTGLSIQMAEATVLGQEVVVSASRVEERIMESPVSIEKMDILQVQTTPADNYYKGLANLKGVDVTTSSINFQIINARGFGSTGNTRFVQLIDGMDTQAPALNFPIGNLNGPSELDVESVEMIPGAASALYGPNAFNGVLLVNSKNPFDYQGLSAFAKSGVNHVGDPDAGASPMWEGAIRYAKAIKNRFAFKISLSGMKALDWYGTDATDREIARTPQGFNFNPGSDRLHYMGDEAAIALSIFRLSTSVPGRPPGWQTLASGPYGQFNDGSTAWDYAQDGWLPGHVVSVTPFREQDLIDYNAKNIKGNVGLYYRLNDKVELSYLYNGGFGTSVYTGAQRYSLKNFSIQQHRLQLRGDNFFVRAYTTRENSGDSYIVEFLAKRLNDIRSAGGVSTWLGSYGINYLRYLNEHPSGQFVRDNDPSNNVAVPIDIQMAAHNYARTQTDQRYPLTAFESAKAQAMLGVVPNGPMFADRTNMYHAEGQYDFKNEIKSMELLAGGSFRMFDLNSKGTIFADSAGTIGIKEYGAYVQAGKWLGDRKVKISGSARYDKNQNFNGRVNPRLSVVYKVSENHNIRVSYQTGFRVPTTQGQHIDLNIISARLLGGLPKYAEKYNLVRASTTGQPLSFEGFSVQAYRDKVFAQGASQAAIFDPTNIALLKPVTEFKPVKPERVQSIEVGYKGLIANSLFIDAAYYYNMYNDFITQIRIVTASELPGGSPNYASTLNGTAHVFNPNNNYILEGNTSQIYTNSDEKVTSQGAVVGLTYNLARGYTLGGNYNWNVLNTQSANFLSEFNTPEHKFNLSFGNRKLTENLGFNVNLRWQSEFEWQSSFTLPANGLVPAYSTLDAQVSYKVPSIKSTIKLGGSNLANKRYIQSLGGPMIGAIYYLSVTFDEMFR